VCKKPRSAQAPTRRNEAGVDKTLLLGGSLAREAAAPSWPNASAVQFARVNDAPNT